jgi:ABC-type multidrug transport system fused ATPase/permease subunit
MEEKDVDEQFKSSRTMSDWEILKRLFQFIGRDRKRLVVAFICIFTNAVIGMIMPLIFQQLIDQGLGGSLNATTGSIQVIDYWGQIYAIVAAIMVVAYLGQNYLIQYLTTKMMYNMRREAFINLQDLGFDFFNAKDRSTGKVISYITNDVETIQELVQSGLLTIIAQIFTLVGSLIFMLVLSVDLTLFSLMILPVVAVLGISVFRLSRKYFREMRRKIAAVTGRLQESITGMRVIKQFAVEEQDFARFYKATDEELFINNKAARLFTLLPAVITVVMGLGLGLVLLRGGYLYIYVGNITEGTIFAFVMYLIQFVGPMASVFQFISLIQNSMAAGERLIKLIDTKSTIVDEAGAAQIVIPEGEVVFDNVSFEYEPGVPVLRNINLVTQPKERVAVVGYTGAGKTTMISLLSRFWDPTEGRILIDGQDIQSVTQESLRNQMGIVLQDNFLFSGTIRNNIRYGKLDATDEEVEAAAKMVGAHDFIIEMDKGYDTQVAERGSRLSVGQRQLIAFARAIISNPPILILDEATSAVDPYSELIIQEALEKILGNRTSFTIAHRLSTILNAHTILVVDDGQIVEKGNHEELLALDGLYAHLYSMQFKESTKLHHEIE